MIVTVSSLLSVDLPWIHSIEEAKRVAQKEHKDIYVFLGAERCSFCVRYKNEVLANEGVKKYLNDHFVKVFLNRDKHKIPDYFEKFGVPRHYFLKPNGEIYFSDAGIKGVNGFYMMVEEADLHR